MKIRSLLWEDTVNYKKVAAFIGTACCSFKCGVENCHNYAISSGPIYDLDSGEFARAYMWDTLTEAIIFSGLEPFDQYDELFAFVKDLAQFGITDDIVIYTGYNKAEIWPKVESLHEVYLGDLVVKYGRYKPGDSPHLDRELGVKLASSNQFAERYTREPCPRIF